ncbi:hypothetical protein SLE2022_115390 [Rubroshorea leprosula]
MNSLGNGSRSAPLFLKLFSSYGCRLMEGFLADSECLLGACKFQLLALVAMLPQSPLHLIRDCPIVYNLWKSIPIPTNLQNSFHFNLLDWLKANCSPKT